jgi:hypothetical protein
MRMRSIPYLAVALLSWLLVWRFMKEVKRTPFRDEFGSTAFPVPPYIQFLALGAFGSALVGVPMLVVDVTRWIKNRKA